MLDQQQTWIILALVAATAVLFSKKSKPPLPYPPVLNRSTIGLLLDIPKGHPWEIYTRWSEECNSDIVFATFMGSNFLFLNSLESALDLLDKRSVKYSGRPKLFVMAQELAGWKWLPGLMTYGEAWRERRKLFQKHFNADPFLYQNWQEHYTKKMLENILESPDKFWEHMYHAVTGAITASAYGIKVQANDDPYVKLAAEGNKSLNEMTEIPGSYLVNFLPFLKYVPDWFPGVEFKRKAKKYKEVTDRFREEPFLAALDAMDNGSAQPCFVSKCLQNLAENTVDSAETKEEIRNASMDMAAGIFLGGADTVTAGISTFILTMVCYPEIQKKAQEELDRVVGHGRLPEFKDEESLPYLSAIIKEVHRWRPTIPGGTAHATTEDDEYRGYYIPKDTVVLNNVWAILHDPKAYHDPHRFIPERFLTADGKRLNTDVRDPISVAAFGFGRRACPGKHAGLSATWLVAAYMLSAFNLEKPTDPVTGEVIEPSMEYQFSVVYAPVPFEMKVTPRSDKAVKMISMLAG